MGDHSQPTEHRHDHDEAGSKPAPGTLRLVQTFINSIDLESGRDAWTDPTALGEWLRRHELLDDGALPTQDDLARARTIREALRRLLVVNNGGAADAVAAEEVLRHARRAPLMVRIGEDGSTRLEPVTGGLDGALARLFAAVHDAAVAGTWVRLKSCRSDACGWAFYDSSKNRSGTWCSMRVCGSREKSRTYRRRVQAPTASGGPSRPPQD